MSGREVAIVGSGIAAIFASKVLSEQGFRVTLFEKGPSYPYPHAIQGREWLFRPPGLADFGPGPDLQWVTMGAGYTRNLNDERGMVVGGSATHWTAITPRMHPTDFATRTLFGFGADWPVKYDDLEPYYGLAERLIGVSGTDADNPFAPHRSSPFPLPAFDLTRTDLVLAERLRSQGITLHTTPQARTRHAYDERPACQNFGTCRFCPIGARYSPNHELHRLLAGGRVSLRPETSVRRVILDRPDRARGLLVQKNDSRTTEEFWADAVIVATGAIEASRLLLLSADERYPDGVGNRNGMVGRNFTFHHLWIGTLQYEDKMFGGRLGPVTSQSQQFCNPDARGTHGGIKIEFSSHFAGFPPLVEPKIRAKSGGDIVEQYQQLSNCRGIIFHAESAPSNFKYIKLSDEVDRFGDPFAHVAYESSEFDSQTYRFADQLLRRFAGATKATVASFDGEKDFNSGAHHMGGCAMGVDPKSSVVDSFGQVHGVPNLFVLGSAVFPGTSGCMNPTLTLSALALRTADRIASQAL